MISEVQLAAMIAGFTELLKQSGVSRKYLKACAVVVGGAIAAFDYYNNGMDPLSGAVKGIVAGAVTTGLYATASSISKK